MTTVRLATEADVPQMARVQMRAFADDPLITWMLPEDEFERRATLMFDCMLRAGLVNGAVYTTDDGVGTAEWSPPGKWSFTDEQMAMMAEPFAEAAGERAERALSAFAQLSDAHPPDTHWYLAGLGTHPDWQRRGIASALLEPVLAACDGDGIPAYLETQKESNLPFYRSHGWEVSRTLQLAEGGPKMWLMWREPRER